MINNLVNYFKFRLINNKLSNNIIPSNLNKFKIYNSNKKIPYNERYETTDMRQKTKCKTNNK